MKRRAAQLASAAALALLVESMAARAEAPAFTAPEYACLDKLGHEEYEDLSKPAIDAMPLYVRENLRQLLNGRTCEEELGVLRLVKPYITEEDVTYLKSIGVSARRVDIMPKDLNVGVSYLIHDPSLDAAAKKSAILALVQKKMPPSFSLLTESDLDFMDLTMSEGEALERMPPNLIAELHEIINDPKLTGDARHEKVRTLLAADDILTPEDIAYLHSIGHHEDYLGDPTPNLKGVHFEIADTTVPEEEKRRRIDALIGPETKRRTDWAATQQGEALMLDLFWGFPIVAVILMPLALRLTGRARFDRWKRYLPWAVGAVVAIWAVCMVMGFV